MEHSGGGNNGKKQQRKGTGRGRSDDVAKDRDRGRRDTPQSSGSPGKPQPCGGQTPGSGNQPATRENIGRPERTRRESSANRQGKGQHAGGHTKPKQNQGSGERESSSEGLSHGRTERTDRPSYRPRGHGTKANGNTPQPNSRNNIAGRASEREPDRVRHPAVESTSPQQAHRRNDNQSTQENTASTEIAVGSPSSRTSVAAVSDPGKSPKQSSPSSRPADQPVGRVDGPVAPSENRAAPTSEGQTTDPIGTESARIPTGSPDSKPIAQAKAPGTQSPSEAGAPDGAATAPEAPTPGKTPPEDAQPVRPSEAEPTAISTEQPGPDAAAAPPPIAPQKPLTLDKVESFPDFVRYLTELEGDLKPLDLKSGSAARVALAQTMDLAIFEDEIRALAARDTKLTTTLALLTTADRAALTGSPRQNLTALAAAILSGHPAFADDAVVHQRLSALLSGTAEASTLSQLIVRLRNLAASPFAGGKALKGAALVTLNDNATHAAVLIAASAEKWDVAHLIDSLAENVWDAGSGFADSVVHREKLTTLPKASRKTAALILDVARARVREAEGDRDAALGQVDAGIAERKRLTEALEEAHAHTRELETQFDGARKELEAQVVARRSEKMGATTDFETLRVDTVRVITDQIAALEDALDALEHGQPQITQEFVGRCVNTLRKRLSSLQPRVAPGSQGENE